LILIKRYAAIAALGAGLTACTSGQSAVEPTVNQVNIASSTTLQFAVGTANIGGAAAPALNTVVTFRQNANGFDGTLFNLPSIVGPAGFVNNGPVATTGSDLGTNKISSTPTLPLVGIAATQTTFVTGGISSGGAFEYGFAPDNTTTSGSAVFTEYSEPFFAKQQQFVGGPPAFPFVRDGSFPTTFRGYPPGFTIFDSTTVALGSYGLTVSIPSANSATTTLTTAATLASLALLPTIAAPVTGTPAVLPAVGTTCTHAGGALDGLTINVVIPAGFTEAAVYVEDTTTVSFYTFRTTTAGAQTFTIPANQGPAPALGKTSPSFNVGTPPVAVPPAAQLPPGTPGFGDTVVATVVGYDYPALEGGPPGNTSAAPTIKGAGGQADLSMSPKSTCTF